MKVSPTELPDVCVVEPRVFEDQRGALFEAWRDERYADLVCARTFVQDNVSSSRRGTLRGLHFQQPHAQGKLISVLCGEAWEVVVDVRRDSPTSRRWVSVELSAANRRQLWVPPGFAHGFQALTDDVVLHYKCTDLYHPECERTVRWDDPALGIPWPIRPPVLAPKDAAAPLLSDIPLEHLPRLS